MENKTPFTDPIRQMKFTQLYYWCQSIGMSPEKSFFIARSKTIKTYPFEFLISNFYE